mmetsp:Transcript_16530/g.27418  ORF Transcript_16530/g.27418 Transcript_16530/m.27418 type:complete len:99 (+) Transcript_16530:172-468(+)
MKPTVVKHRRGRRRTEKVVLGGEDRDMSSASKFLKSMTVFEIKDSLKRLKMPLSGNRRNLLHKLTSALMVDEDSPIEALPDLITTCRPRQRQHSETTH